MENKILLILILGILLIGNVMALDSLGTFKQNENVNISQVCSDATYITISSISYPNSTRAVTGKNMTLLGNGEFYYNFNSTLALGKYNVNGISDGCEKTFATYFEITPSGQTDNLGLYIILIGIVYLIGFFGFFGKNPWVSALGGLGMLALGVYFIGEGVIIYRDWLTNTVAYLTIGLGAIFTLIPLIEFIVKEFE